jgi:hypothetical protein
MHGKLKVIFSTIILVTITQAMPSQSTAMPQTSNYGDHESYMNSKLKIRLEYSSDWKILELQPPALSSLKGFVSFEPPKSEKESQSGMADQTTPVIIIMAEQLKFKNITIHEFAKIKSDSIRHLFSDFDFKLENKTAITIGNNTAMKIVYTIVDPYNTDDDDDPSLKNGMEIWTIKADTIYTISYFGEQDQYIRHLPFIKKLTDSFEFIH